MLRFCPGYSSQEVELMTRYSAAAHLAIAIAILAVTLQSSLGQSTKENGLEQAVKQQEALYADAVKRQDIAALQTILSEDFLATSSRGELRNRAMELDDLKPNQGYSIDDFHIDDIRVRPFENTAIVMGRQILEVRYNKQPLTSLFRYTRVWVKRGDRWQILGQQLTALPQPVSR